MDTKNANKSSDSSPIDQEQQGTSSSSPEEDEPGKCTVEITNHLGEVRVFKITNCKLVLGILLVFRYYMEALI